MKIVLSQADACANTGYFISFATEHCLHDLVIQAGMLWIASPDSIHREWKGLVKKTGTIRIGPEAFREQQHNQRIEISKQEMFDKILDYIYLNPVMAGFVIRPEDWKYSSAKDFCGITGLIVLNFT